MEAPEEIYVNYRGFGVFDEPCVMKMQASQIEYTRTDAFIEKAEKFFTEKFEVEDYNDNIDIDGSPIFNYGRFIDDFKKYIGE